MSRTIKAIKRDLAPAPRKCAPAAEATLVAQWQDGLQTLSGYQQQRLRLSIERLPQEQKQAA